MPELHFSSWTAFFAMGGYGLFVWLSFGVSFLLLLVLVWHSMTGQRRLMRRLAANRAREQRIQQHLKSEQSP